MVNPGPIRSNLYRFNEQFNLIGVWTMRSPKFEYIGQFWKYLQLNKERIAESNAVICGDFNSNVCWDKKRRHWNHSDVVSELEELGICSMYHNLLGIDHGQEKVPTIFHRKNSLGSPPQVRGSIFLR